MKNYKRPWWLLAAQMPLLETILKENHTPTQKRFTIIGKPILKSLSWVVYGPLTAVVIIGLFAILALMIDIQNQVGFTKWAFACFMGLTPFAGWLGGSILFSKISQLYLDREIEDKTETVEITADLETKTLHITTLPSFAFEAVESFKLMTDAGIYYDAEETIMLLFNVVMNTTSGQYTVLSKDMGNIKQKQQLISQLEAIISG